MVTDIEMHTWTPILTGDARAEALAAVKDIASAVLRPGIFANSSLANGQAGAALFFAFLARTRGDERYLDVAFDFLRGAVDALAEGRVQMAALYGGFTGIAWAAERCRAISADDEDPNTDVDDVLAASLACKPWRADYDLISGLAGLGLYALERRDAALLTNVIDRLNENAEITSAGATWFTESYLLHPTQRDAYPNGNYNLGLAHGVPGVIAVLAHACAAGIAVEKARPLLDGAVRWLLAQKNSEQRGCWFPTVVLREDDGSAHSSRVSWCYGDLGISLALLWAARSVGEPAWEREALEIARHAARLANPPVPDAALCHGAAGNGHLFNRLYQATREPLFLETSQAWFARALAMRKPGTGIGGYQAHRVDIGWHDVPGLLEGSIGIAMALLAAISDVTPDWDRMLLVSVPPR